MEDISNINKNFCKCGCKTEIPLHRNYAIGHQWIGRKHSPESRKKMLNGSAQTRMKKRLAHLGMKRTIESVEKGIKTRFEREFAKTKGICRHCNKPIIEKEAVTFYLKKDQWHCLDCYREEQRLRKLKCRTIVLEHYGNKCKCCGETTKEFLTIDHINNDGSKHRKVHGVSGAALYPWIITNNFPKDLQLLCFNCNCAKSIYKVCPHQKGKIYLPILTK